MRKSLWMTLFIPLVVVLASCTAATAEPQAVQSSPTPTVEEPVPTETPLPEPTATDAVPTPSAELTAPPEPTPTEPPLIVVTADDVQRMSVAEGQERKRSFPVHLVAIAGAALLIIAGAVLLWPRGGGPTAASAPAAVDSVAEDGVVRLPLSTFDDGQARFYTHEANGVAINYFVLKSSDGVVRAAFDACDVCFHARLGYRQEGDEMVCNNCNQRFPSVLINEVHGGCNPSPLERTVEGDELVIRVADILTGAGYFE